MSLVGRRRPERPPVVENKANADHAWKALGLVVDWIKHAETKAGATLAATGVSGGVLYNLIKDVQYPNRWLVACAIICGVAVFAAGFCAGLVLWPRLRMKEPPTSLLYFSHIARGHLVGDTYVESLIALTKDIDSLVAEIASQGWANSKVAHRKYFWGSLAIRFLLFALLALAATAVLRATKWG